MSNNNNILVTPSSTNTTPITSTPNAIPTLSVEDARLELLKLLVNYEDCRLPCQWGITPGQSTYQEAQTILSSLSSISDFTLTFESEGGAVFPDYVEDDVRINMSIGFLVNPNTNVVSNITFGAQALSELDQGDPAIFGHPLYDRLLKAYLLPQILTTYGTPADALIRTNSEPPQNWRPFELLISYPEQGILVHYTTPLNAVGPNIIGCPTKSKLELYLRPSGSFNSTNELLESRAAPLKIEEIFPGFRPVEEVTSLSLDDFVRIFSQPTNECIETPASYWPSP